MTKGTSSFGKRAKVRMEREGQETQDYRHWSYEELVPCCEVRKFPFPYVPKGDARGRIEVKEVDRTSILTTGEGLVASRRIGTYGWSSEKEKLANTSSSHRKFKNGFQTGTPKGSRGPAKA
ncbi:60S ribosomal protein L37B [Exophiala xenobiotica]|nr:60S ribosomal protein L37B [Exophiala xenobiotica]